MQSYKNELIVTKGETFTIDKLLQNKDGSPYIVSSRLSNPYWLISVSNTLYSQENRYIKNYWLPVNVPRFNSTIAINIKDIKSSNLLDAPSLYNSFNDVTSFPMVGWYNGAYVTFDNGLDSVFYEEDDNGNRVYKYWLDDRNTWAEYSCRINKTFLQSDTKEWISQNYQYSIQLVSGTLMREHLINLASEYNIIVYPDMDNEVIYDLIVNKEVKFPVNFDVNQALGSIDTSYPILGATKLKVLDNTGGNIV